MTDTKKPWNTYPNNTPPDIPQDENFGIEYEVKYKLPDGTIKRILRNGCGIKHGIVFIR